MKIQYRPAAIADLAATSEYIQTQLHNPSAAAKLRADVLHGVSQLADTPEIGPLLRSKYEDIASDVRFLVIRKQMVFYEIHDQSVEIIRILDGRTDYLAQLFGYID